MAGDISNYGRMKNIYNYPNDVQFNDGHYILFNIFEKAGVDYHRPFTRVSGVAQSAGQATIQKNSFGSFIKKTPSFGKSFICADDADLKSIINKYKTGNSLTYGFSNKSNYQILNVIKKINHSIFDLKINVIGAKVK